MHCAAFPTSRGLGVLQHKASFVSNKVERKPVESPEDHKAAVVKCMSFVPAPQQQASAASSSSNVVTSSMAASAAASPAEVSDAELLFKMRTFDVYWVDKSALMYRDGIAKVSHVLSIWS